jgi:penicillin-binding protein 1A
MDAQTGLVTTLLGGRDYDHSEFDRAFMARRQPGSAFKPIVYLAALGSGLRPNEAIPTDPIRLAQRGSEDWEPGDHVSAQRLSVRDALVYSSNTASVRVGQRAGIERVIEQAHAMGISEELPRYPSIFLGSGEVIPAELVAAYATFGNGGHTIQPHLITRIEDGKGRVLYQREPSAGSRAVDPRLGFLVLDMMRDVVRRGTGTRAAGIGVPIAGKTGTTNDSRDLWFVGLTPRLVAGVWLGFDRPATVLADAGGGDLAAPVWGQFMRVAARGGRGRDWAPPPGVIQVTVDARSGMLWSESCFGGEPRTEYFMAGTEPLSQCRSFGSGWVMGPDGQWEYRGYGYGYDSLGSYGSQHTDSVAPWELAPDRYRTRFYRDTLEDRERRRRQAQIDSLDEAWGHWRDTIRVRPEEPEPVPPEPQPAPPAEEPAPTPDTTGL